MSNIENEQDKKLDADACVGNCIFRKGVSEKLVIDAAKRRAVSQKAEREKNIPNYQENIQKLRNIIHDDVISIRVDLAEEESSCHEGRALSDILKKDVSPRKLILPARDPKQKSLNRDTYLIICALLEKLKQKEITLNDFDPIFCGLFKGICFTEHLTNILSELSQKNGLNKKEAIK